MENTESQKQILSESQTYVKRIIFISSAAIQTQLVVVLMLPIYLAKELQASTTTIGLALSLVTLTYTISSPLIPYLAGSSVKCFKYLGYDNLSVLRLFLSTIAVCFIPNVKSTIATVACVILNGFCNIGPETSISSISLLIPDDKSDKLILMTYIIAGVCGIVSALTLSIAIRIISFEQLFYAAAIFYACLFIYSVFSILGKESKLMKQQMKHFDEMFYLAKKKKILQNKIHKYRRKSSLVQSIEMFLNKKTERMTDINESERVDFPIYDRKATQIVQVQDSDGVILTKTDWMIIYLMYGSQAFKGSIVTCMSNWFVLYAITRFDTSISLATLIVACGAFGCILGLLFYPKSINLIITILFGKEHKCDTQQKITVNCIITGICIISGIIVISWVDIVPYFNYGWFVAFSTGYCFGQITLQTIMIIRSLNTEHLEEKLLGIANSAYQIGGCVSLFVTGLLGIHSVIYVVTFSMGMIPIISVLVIIIARTIKKSADETASVVG